MFYYEPDAMPDGDIHRGRALRRVVELGPDEATSVGRSYNYPHVAALHWVLYRLARNHQGLVTNHALGLVPGAGLADRRGHGPARAPITPSSARWAAPSSC